MKSGFKIEGTKAVATAAVDPNGDGQPVVTVRVEIDLLEIPDEVMSAISKKKSEKAA